MTDQTKPQTWQDIQLEKLFQAVLERTIFTYMLNELVKTGVKTPLKDGVIKAIRDAQAQRNLIILNTVRRIDRGIQE